MIPSSPEVSERMSRVRNRDTDAEMALRRELHRRGLRYRVNLRIPGLGRVRPDIVFTRRKLVVFIDGCFWHRCPIHATHPKTNADWWEQKLETNVRRDRKTDQVLVDAGWTVIRIWEHEDPVEAADRVQRVLTVSANPSH
jgi:DNA mismatch endonuclease, patch repair protein